MAGLFTEADKCYRLLRNAMARHKAKAVAVQVVEFANFSLCALMHMTDQ